jgi:hypothetical protein
MLVLVIGIGIVDCGATIWAGLKLQAAAKNEISRGVDELMDKAPEIISTAVNDYMNGGDSGT